MVARIAASRPLLFVLIAASLAIVLVSALRYQAPELFAQRRPLIDFDAFHIAGTLANEGRAGDAYHTQAMLEAQHNASGGRDFMPWTYPPPFTLFMQGLARLPVGMAFALFTLTSFAFYLWVLWRIAGPGFLLTLIAVMPAATINLRTGQNGFLVAGLIGTFLLAFRHNRTIAGLPLGLMVIKPHLAAGVGLVTLLKRRWPVVFASGAVAAGLLALSTLAYGPGIWEDFRHAVQEAGGFLASGYYPLFRMSSIYAAAYTLGLGPWGAMALQAIGALGALWLLGWGCLRGMAYPRLAALTCAASLFVSPYGYDYDLTILGVALAFVMPDLLAKCRGREVVQLLLLSWFACGYGMAWTTALPETGAEHGGLALIAPALVLLCWRTARILPPQAPGTPGTRDIRPARMA